MSLSSIAGDIKSAVEQGSAWLAKAVEEHVPALLTEAERIESSVIFQALEGVVFPPAVEQEIANVIKAFASVVAAVPVQPTSPVEPAPEVPAEPAEPSAA